MKKSIMITGFAFAALVGNAQIKVYTGGKVYVGGTTTTPSSFLSSGGAGNSLYQAYFYNAQTTNSTIGMRAEVAPPIGSSNSYAASGAITITGAGNAFGVIGSAYNATAQAGGVAVGVYGYAGNSSNGLNYGVYGRLVGSRNGSGIYGADDLNSTTVISGKYAGYFAGRIATTDALPEKPGGGSWNTLSDERVKKNIGNFKDGLEILRKIRPVNFTYNGMGGYPSAKPFIGIIAQEVQKVAPYCISKTRIVLKESEKSDFSKDIIETLKDSASGGNKYVAEALSYNQDGLFYVMLNSIKQLDSTVTDLQKQLTSCCKAKTNATSRQSNEPAIHDLELANNTVLFQNFPNPFGDGTTIKYFIPDNIANAQIVFFDEFGNKLKEFVVEEKGMGQLNITTSNLSSGIYSYSLIVNGKVIDSKKMVKAQ